jgi:hypothetical protein
VTLVTHFHALEAAGLNLVDRLADLGAGLDQFFAAFGVDDRRSGVILRPEAGDLHGLHRVKLADDRVGGAVFLVQRPQERRRGNLAALVDADGQGVLLGDGAFDPASALGDDAAAVQRAVAFLHFDQEIDAGRAVQADSR